jgi:HEAT repeat protein
MRQVREAALIALFELPDAVRCSIKAELARGKVNADLIATDLEKLFRSDKPDLPEAALALYPEVGGQRDLGPLLGCILEEVLRPPALQAFAALGEAAYGRLLVSLANPDPQQFLALIHVAGELGFARGLPLALDGARAADPQLRHAAARAMGQLGGVTELSLLRHLLEDELAEIQDAAAGAIARIGQRQKTEVVDLVVPLLQDQDETKRMRLVRVLCQLDGEEIETHLLKAFKDSSSRVRCEALRALAGRLSEPVMAGVTLALTDESAEVRRLAVGALGRYPQPRALPALRLAAVDSDFWVRVAVMRVLANFSGAEVQPLLLSGVDDPVGAVAVAALETSVHICPTASRQLLEKALSHADAEVVKVAMHQLGELNGLDWIMPFADQLLDHRNWDVRLHAVRSLGRSGLSQASQLLEKRLKLEEEALVRQALETAVADRVRDARRDR